MRFSSSGGWRLPVLLGCLVAVHGAGFASGAEDASSAFRARVMPVLSAGATYAIGKAFIQHFESGGTLLDFNPPDYKEFIKAQKEMWNSRSKSSSADAQTSHPGS